MKPSKLPLIDISCRQVIVISIHFAKGGYDPALPSVTVFHSRQLIMNAGLYRKTMKSIDMSLFLLNRVSDDIGQLSKRDTIEKLRSCDHLFIFSRNIERSSNIKSESYQF